MKIQDLAEKDVALTGRVKIRVHFADGSGPKDYFLLAVTVPGDNDPEMWSINVHSDVSDEGYTVFIGEDEVADIELLED